MKQKVSVAWPPVGDPLVETQLKRYAKKYAKKLSTTDAEIVEKLLEECDSDFKNSHPENPHSSKLNQPSVFWLSSDSITKVFLFTQYDKIPLSSWMQDKAFETLGGDEFEYYFKQFVKRWLEAQTSEGESDFLKYWIPSAIKKLRFNKQVTFEHYIPFLDCLEIGSKIKEIIIKCAADGIQRLQGSFLTEKQITYLQNISSTYQYGVRLKAITPSVKHHQNMEEFPDSWVEEMFNLNRGVGPVAEIDP